MFKNTIVSTIILIILLFNINKSFSYNLNNKDKIIINNKDKIIINNIENKIQEKNYIIILAILDKLKKIKKQYKYNIRIYTILNKIIFDLNKNYNNKYNLNGLEIDLNIIKNNWLNWHNQKRIGLQKLTYSEKLNNSANSWSKEMSEKGIMTHKRTKNETLFYNYDKITKRLKEKGVVCLPYKGITNSESIGINYFKCNKNQNCTYELSKSLKKIFNIYYQEKGLPYPQNAHYKAIIHPGISRIGLGITIKNDINGFYKVYITTHYCSKLKY